MDFKMQKKFSTGHWLKLANKKILEVKKEKEYLFLLVAQVYTLKL